MRGDTGSECPYTRGDPRRRPPLVWPCFLSAPAPAPLTALEPAGSSAAGVRAWGALAALQDGKAPPAPGAANSSFKRSSLQEALVFEGPSWQLELSNMTGAIVGLRFKGCTDQRGCQNSNRSGGTDPESWAAAWLRAPAAWLGRRGGSAAPLQEALQQASWAAFDAPLALPIYSTYAEDDYDAIFGRYTWASTVWSLRDFGKPNATGAQAARGTGGACWSCFCRNGCPVAHRTPHRHALPAASPCRARSQGRRSAGRVPAAG